MKELINPRTEFDKINLIVDEFEYTSNAVRINMSLEIDLEGNVQRMIFLDSLDCYNKFKMVFGFSPYVSSVMLNRVRAICPDTLVLDIGNMKAGGVREEYDMRYIFRDGNDPD